MVQAKKFNELLSPRNVHWEKSCKEFNIEKTLISQDLDVSQTKDLKSLLATLVDVLKERSSSINCSTFAEDRSTLYRNSLSFLHDKEQFTKDIQTDVNNNEEKTRLVDVGIQFGKHLSFEDSSGGCTKNCSSKRSCVIEDKSQSHPNQSQLRNDEIELTKTRNQVTRFTETGECTCTDSKRCHAKSDCGYFCCSNYPQQSRVKYTSVKNQDSISSSLSRIKNPMQNGNQCTRKTIDAAYVECCVEDVRNCFESWKKDSLIRKCEPPPNDKKLQSYGEHLERCRELLGECGLKNTNGIRVNNALGHIRGVGVMKSPRGTWNMPCQMEDQMRPVIENRRAESHCSLKCPKECPDLPPYSTNSAPLLITNDQGLVEVHVLSLQLAKSAAAVLFQEENLSNVSLFISWNIWGQETVRTPSLKCPKLNFNSSFVYHIPDLFTFFNCVLSEYVIFQANVVDQSTTSYAVARAKLCIKDILDYPQNKLHYIAPVNSVISCTLGMNFGQLSLWVRLSCDVEQVEAFKRQCGLLPSVEQFQGTIFQENAAGSQEEKRNPEKTIDETMRKMLDGREREEIARIGGQQLEIEKDSRLRDTTVASNNNKSYLSVSTDESYDSDIISKPKNSEKPLKWETTGNEEQRTNDAVQEETPSVTEFKSLLSHTNHDDVDQNSTIRDMLEVFGEENWNHYKRKSLLAFSEISKVPTPADDERDENDPLKTYPLEKDTIVIEIANVNLFENSSVMRDNDVHLLYVEYSFLGYRGADMETESIPKPKTAKEKLIYNFIKTFPIDEEHHSIERNTLRAMLDQSINPNIKFILVSEPLPEETDSKDCVEVGYAYFNIRKYALGDNNKIIVLSITNQDKSEQIGVLQIYVLGLDAIRQCLGDDM